METIGEYMCKTPHQLHHHHQESIIVAGENSFFYQFQERPEEKWYWKSYEEEESSSMDEEDDVLERFLKEIDAKGHGMIKKLISKVENNIPLEEEFRDAWHHLGGNRASRMLETIARKVGREREGEFVRRERGIDLERELKNERFKMKTVNIAGSGVVKEEGRQ